MIGVTMIIAGIILGIIGAVLLLFFYKIKPLVYQSVEISPDERQSIIEHDNSLPADDDFDDNQETVLHHTEKDTGFGENEETALDTEQNEFGADEETVLNNKQDEFGADEETALNNKQDEFGADDETRLR